MLNENSSILDVTGDFRVDGGSTFGGHLIPSTNITYDLGSSTNKWKDTNCEKVNITIPGSAVGLTGFNVFQPGMGDGGYFIADIIGKASGSSYNSMQRFYSHVGDGSTSNAIDYAWWGISNAILRMTAQNRVGINISGNPLRTLDVGGDLNFSGNLFNNDVNLSSPVEIIPTSYTNGFSGFTSFSTKEAAYYKDGFNRVYIDGAVISGSASGTTTIFNIPSGYRNNAGGMQFWAVGQDGLLRVAPESNGDINVVDYITNKWLVLHISYLATA